MTQKRADNFNNKQYWLYAYKDEDGILDVAGYYNGLASSDMKASFNMNYGRIFGPHTNPLPKDATDINGSHYEDVGMLVKSSSGTTITVDFKYNYNPYSISENTTWDGQIFLDNTVTVQSGSKLTIKPNTQVFIGDGKAINVYGELEADGVTFTAMDNNWTGITYHSGSDGYIRNSTIEKTHEYGGAAIRIYSNNFMEIDGNTIQNLTGAASGISLINADNVYIYDNRIENTTNYGIYAYNSDGKIFDNFIKNFTNSGIYASSYSHVVLSAISGSNYVGENSVIGGKYGLQIGYQAYLNAGNSSSFASQNRIANQSGSGWAHIYSTSAYSNTAKYNYFKHYNSSSTSPVTNGSLSVYPWLYTAPNPGAGFKVVATEETKQTEEELLLEEAMMYKYQNNYTESEKILSRLITESTEGRIIQQSLMEYAWVAQLSNDESFFKKLEGLESGFSSSINEIAAKSALAKLHYSKRAYDKALKQLDKIIEKNPDTEEEQAALIFASCVATDAGYSGRALEYYGLVINDRFKTSTQSGELLELNHYMQNSMANHEGENEFDEGTDLELPKSIFLSNYPNPFNPTTTINYALPEQAGVTLKLYDLLGREVALLVNEVKDAGEYSVNFDASRLSSGVYIYQLKVGNSILSKKMTLIK